MKRIRLLLGILLVLSIASVFGQQDPQYTQYMYNQNVMNPAYAGSREGLNIGLLGRTQWVGVNGSPKTLTLSLHSPINKSLGLGLSVIHDEIGPASEDNVYADFSYTIKTSAEGRLAFGLKGGLTFLDVDEIDGLDPRTDPTLNDPIHKTMPNFGAGIFYYTQKFYAAFSAPNFLETHHFEKNNGQTSVASENTHYFLTSGFVFDLSKSLKLKPSFMVKAVPGAPISIDLSGNVLINEKLELGLSYRLDDSISGIIGFNITNDFRLGYAYDHTISNYGRFNSGSHEIMLSFIFNKEELNSPRFF